MQRSLREAQDHAGNSADPLSGSGLSLTRLLDDVVVVAAVLTATRPLRPPGLRRLGPSQPLIRSSVQSWIITITMMINQVI